MTGTCARCGRVIVSPDGVWWTHLGEDGASWRGCRAASFDESTGWDESLPRTWKATP